MISEKGSSETPLGSGGTTPRRVPNRGTPASRVGGLLGVQARGRLQVGGHRFQRPLAATIFDGDHSGDEERWVTIGKDEEGRYILLVHTFQEVEPNRASVRIHFGAPPNQNGNRSVRRDIPMKPEYDFKNAERGKFFRPGAVLRLPIYLEPEVQDYLAAKAQAKIS